MAFGQKKKVQSQVKQTYINLLTAFGVIKKTSKGEDMITINVKTMQGYTGKNGWVGGTDEVISREAFLLLMGEVYDGDRSFTLSLFETDIAEADMKGGLRITQDELEALEEGKPTAKKKAKATASKVKPRRYEVEEEDEEEEEEPAPKPRKAAPKAKPAPEPLVEEETDDDELMY
jgi:hypothetical protein